ncbi:hypothetical protein TcasGA2_TC031606 [Tribolium castaneum]|uniref:Uncharacterized protein n=1 Tax=Tribolium castaneum TaxID=7070 RepID=A0A139WAG2_TRICA|nr:hypothetical protein TcasGA2_TC031606 [Tribolium castaneum]
MSGKSRTHLIARRKCAINVDKLEANAERIDNQSFYRRHL